MHRGVVVATTLFALAAACSNGSSHDSEASQGGSGAGAAAGEAVDDPTPPDRGIFVVGTDGVDLYQTPEGPATGRIRAGVLLPYDGLADGFAHVTTPCENRAWVDLGAGRASGPYRVVIDPGHGGADEPGAVGPTGLTEAEVNLDISERVIDLLEGRGIPSALTRTDDYRATLAFRVQVAIDADAEVFVSIHHNAEPDEFRDTPGTETFYQFRSDDSRRLTGLLQEEIFAAFARYDVTFGADLDAGAKWRLGSSGDDYYGVVRRTFEAGIAATLVEAAFLSNPEEEALLRRDEVRQAEAEAIARGIERYFAGEEPGDVFTEPYPRSAPAGGGGGRAGCVDPA